MEGMGDELAANTTKALQELAARMTETEVDGEMSKLVIRAAVERNREGIEDLRSDTAARFQAAQVHADQMRQAQSDDLTHAVLAVEQQLRSAQAEGREELAASITEAADNLRAEAAERQEQARRQSGARASVSASAVAERAAAERAAAKAAVRAKAMRSSASIR